MKCTKSQIFPLLFIAVLLLKTAKINQAFCNPYCVHGVSALSLTNCISQHFIHEIHVYMHLI